jgi:fumarate reductase flavoprotein subunit/urocanate reductase
MDRKGKFSLIETRDCKIDRRDLIKNAALVGIASLGLGALSACSTGDNGNNGTGGDIATRQRLSATGIIWESEHDFVIVGAGGAGLGAALTAVENGASVLTIEFEQSPLFSNTSLCGGVAMACATSVQEEMGFRGDSAENFKNYIDAVSGDMAYMELLHQWADRSTDTFNWMVDKGVVFPAEYLYYSGQEESYPEAATPYPRGHIAEGHIGSSITGVLYDVAMAGGAEFIFNAEVNKLYVDDATGSVVGVATTQGKSYKANKGVILCSGGFSRNKEMLKDFIPAMTYGGSFGSSHQQGDGIRIGLAAGAKIGTMWAVQAKCTGTYLTDVTCPCMTIYSWGMPCVMVNESGERFVAEDTFYEKHYDLIAGQPHSYTFIVWDQDVTDLGSDVISVPPMSRGLTAETDAGYIYKADTFEALAEQMGLPSEVLSATMTRYNELMASGVDTDFGRTAGLGAVAKPPFYAAKLIPAICDTAGGLVVNTKYEVINNFDEPIPGLYAAGATSAGWRGLYYAGSGTAVSYAITSGRIAVESALSL